MGAAVVLGALPLPAVGQPDASSPATLRVRTPGTTVEISEEYAGGHRLPLGDTGLGLATVKLAPGSRRICLANPALGTLCRDLVLSSGQTLDWIVWPAELSTLDAWIELPPEARSVRVVVDGVPGDLVPVEPDREVAVPPLRDVWIEMRDDDGAICLCHPPVLPVLRRYRCPWLCDAAPAG